MGHTLTRQSGVHFTIYTNTELLCCTPESNVNFSSQNI